MNLLVHFVIYGHSWCFESSQIAVASGSCKFENFQNITRAHVSRNTLVFIRFNILIDTFYWSVRGHGEQNRELWFVDREGVQLLPFDYFFH